MDYTYGKWDDYEDAEVAFVNVISGVWTLERFKDWHDHAIVVNVRDATAGEDM
jgi:hypothetical protein